MHILVTNAPGMGYSATVVRGAPTGDMLNEYVGGWFDAVNCWGRVEGRRVDMWVHDEGLLMGLRPTIVVEYGQERDGTNAQPLVGNIVVTATDRDGDTVPMLREEVERWLAHYASGSAVDCNLKMFGYEDKVWERVPMVQFRFPYAASDEAYDDGWLRVQAGVSHTATPPSLEDLMTTERI